MTLVTLSCDVRHIEPGLPFYFGKAPAAPAHSLCEQFC